MVVLAGAWATACGAPVVPVESDGQPAPAASDTTDASADGEIVPPPAPAADAGAPGPAEPRITHAETEEECRRCNGVWGPRGIIGALGCVCPTTDGGKACRRPADCEHRCEIPNEAAYGLRAVRCRPDGDCIGGEIPEGTCSHDFDIFGCRAWIVEEQTPEGPLLGVRQICVD
jgi:hypothetical protein